MMKFDRFVFHKVNAVLEGPEGTCHLSQRAALLLEVLAGRAPEVLSREQLQEVIWPGEAVSESGLYGAINELRTALGDNARQPRFIRTLPRAGYQWVYVQPEVIKEPEVPDAPETPQAPDAVPTPDRQWAKVRLFLLLCCLPLCFLAGRYSGARQAASETLYQEAKAHYRAGRFGQAARGFQACLSRNHRHSAAQLGLIACLQFRNEPVTLLLEEALVLADRDGDLPTRMRLQLLAARQALITGETGEARLRLELAVADLLW